jgi:hypothetical protein
MKKENRGGISRPRVSIEDGESIDHYCMIKNVCAHSHSPHDFDAWPLQEKTQTDAVAMRTVYFIAVSTMSISCSVVPPLTPTPATTSPSLASGTPPPIAE